MSFSFKWSRFSEQFHADAIQLLDSALNKGNKPPVIADKIEVVELEMGSRPPDLEIRDIGDLTMNQFRGIFRLTYAGDAYVVLKTKIQANPLYHKKPDIHLISGSRGMLAANQPLVVPMLLRLSNFRLDSYVVLVVSKQKGITLVFKTDPLQNVDISSSFDSIAAVQTFIQKEIEDLLRRMFREDLPNIIHRLSQRWVTATSFGSRTLARPIRQQELESMSAPDFDRVRDRKCGFPVDYNSPPQRRRSYNDGNISGLRPTFFGTSAESTGQATSNFDTQSQPDYSTSFHNAFDGNVDSFSVYTERNKYIGLGHLYMGIRGLADLTENVEEDVEDWPESMSLGFSDIESFSFPSLSYSSAMRDVDDLPEYETLPAVGGGKIVRPRIYHSSSLLYNATNSSAASTAGRKKNKPISAGSSTYQSSRTRTNHSSGSCDSSPSHTLSEFSSAAGHSISTPPQLSITGTACGVNLLKKSIRKDSVSSASQWTENQLQFDQETEIVVKPGVNNTVSQLSSLNFANQTLSPYTRNLEHFAIRSAPPKRIDPSGYRTPSDKQSLKAKRKRIYRFGDRNDPEPTEGRTLQSPDASSPSPEFDVAEINQYFRAHDEYGTALFHSPKPLNT